MNELFVQIVPNLFGQKIYGRLFFPGIYISHRRKDVPPEFRGLGLRIEDDVLIKPDHQIEVLTEGCAKDLRQIEALIGS